MELVPISHPDVPATAEYPVWVKQQAAEAWETCGWRRWKKTAPKKPAPSKEKTK